MEIALPIYAVVGGVRDPPTEVRAKGVRHLGHEIVVDIASDGLNFVRSRTERIARIKPCECALQVFLQTAGNDCMKVRLPVRIPHAAPVLIIAEIDSAKDKCVTEAASNELLADSVLEVSGMKLMQLSWHASVLDGDHCDPKHVSWLLHK
jgi:hypothetical protein